jgi:cell wall assembly regulator SMI1
MSKKITWERGEKLEEQIIEKTEKKIGFRLPLDFLAIVKEHDGGRPVQMYFDYGRRKRAMFGELLSFNPEKRFNVIRAYESLHDDDEEIELPKEIVPFALDPAGNLLCFDYREKNRPSVVFVDHEEMDEIHFICHTFTDLLSKLYE